MQKSSYRCHLEESSRKPSDPLVQNCVLGLILITHWKCKQLLARKSSLQEVQNKWPELFPSFSSVILRTNDVNKVAPEERPHRSWRACMQVGENCESDPLSQWLTEIPSPFPFKNLHGWAESSELVFRTQVCFLPRLPALLIKATFLSTNGCLQWRRLSSEQLNLNMVTEVLNQRWDDPWIRGTKRWF